MAAVVRLISGFFDRLGLGTLASDVMCGAVLAGAALLLIPAAGFVIGWCKSQLYRLIQHFLGNSAAFWIINFATFPGVILHELSHAFLAKLSGCHIDEICLFEPDGDTLGYVAFTCQGSSRRRAFQLAVSSCAPVIMGYLIILGLHRLAVFFEGHTVVEIFLWHAMISMFCHMTMSRQDLKCYGRGCLRIYFWLVPVGFLLSWWCRTGVL